MIKKISPEIFRDITIDEIAKRVNESSNYRFLDNNNRKISVSPSITSLCGLSIQLPDGQYSGTKDHHISCVRIPADSKADNSDKIKKELEGLIGVLPSMGPLEVNNKKGKVPAFHVTYVTLRNYDSYYKVHNYKLKIFEAKDLRSFQL